MAQHAMAEKGGRKMNILYCIPHLYNAGGMERVLTQKANWLVQHTDYSITILTTERVPEGIAPVYFPLDKRVKTDTLIIDFDADYHKPLLSKWWGHMHRMRLYRKALTDYILREKIDLCISLCGKEIAFLHRLPCRTMAEVHFSKDHRQQLLAANHSGWLWKALGIIRTRQLVRAVRPLQQLVVLTEADKRDWEAAGCNNIVCIPNPCALDGKKIPVLSDKSNIVLAVGRLHEQKGFDMLLTAWQVIESLHPEWSLRIVGEGEQRCSLEKQIASLGLHQVTLAGQVTDVTEEYASAACFVLSSRYEGLPLALIEAMWCGVPSVAFNCPHGPAELLGNDRGWLVTANDTTTLAKQIEYVMTHREEALASAERAKIFAHDTYAEETIMNQWVQLINHANNV